MQFPFSKACQTNSHNASVPNDEFMPCSVIISLLAPTGVTFPLRLARENDKNNTNNNTSVNLLQRLLYNFPPNPEFEHGYFFIFSWLYLNVISITHMHNLKADPAMTLYNIWS